MRSHALGPARMPRLLRGEGAHRYEEAAPIAGEARREVKVRAREEYVVRASRGDEGVERLCREGLHLRSREEKN